MIRFEVVTLRPEGRALVGNRLGDEAVRDLPVVTPIGCARDQPLPLLFLLAGYSGFGAAMLADDPWAEGLVRRLERLADAGQIGAMRIALPNCFTRLGGAQYLNSSAVGNYDDYVWRDCLDAVRARFAVSRVGVAGKSSGGYGALVAGMRHPDLVSAVACHSGDMGFEYSYFRSFPEVIRRLRRDGGVEAFLRRFDQTTKKRSGDTLETIEMIAMSACYSPDPSKPLGVALPFDLETGAVDEATWARWLEHDPVRLVDEEANQRALRSLRLLFIDCGARDEFFLDVGARMLVAKLRTLGIAHQHEEFDDGHMGVTYRYDVSLPLLWRALAAPA